MSLTFTSGGKQEQKLNFRKVVMNIDSGDLIDIWLMTVAVSSANKNVLHVS